MWGVALTPSGAAQHTITSSSGYSDVGAVLSGPQIAVALTRCQPRETLGLSLPRDLPSGSWDTPWEPNVLKLTPIARGLNCRGFAHDAKAVCSRLGHRCACTPCVEGLTGRGLGCPPSTHFSARPWHPPKWE